MRHFGSNVVMIAIDKKCIYKLLKCTYNLWMRFVQEWIEM